LEWITDEPEQQIERAGRTCYKSEDKITKESAGNFTRKLRKLGHEAMLEHASASFRIICNRAVSHEIVRHRIASYAQESTRYCNYSQDKFDSHCTFIKPYGLTKLQTLRWEQHCKLTEELYFTLIDSGVKPQTARDVLPNCLKTEIVMTCNLREWRHFIKLRSSKAAHPQIQEIANEIWKILMEHAPNVFNDLT
jgi:thymidylate synthase (FAD)